MTCHRLVRCPADLLIDQVIRRHPHSRAHREGDAAGVTSWLPARSGRPRLVWQQEFPGSGWFGCCLVIEQGANGVLAHLSAAPVRVSRSPLLDRMSRFAADVWGAHELALLARSVETLSR